MSSDLHVHQSVTDVTAGPVDRPHAHARSVNRTTRHIRHTPDPRSTMPRRNGSTSKPSRTRRRASAQYFAAMKAEGNYHRRKVKPPVVQRVLGEEGQP